MDLVDEQHVVRFENSENRREIPRPLEHGSGRLPQIDAHFVGHDMRERRFAEPGRTGNEDVIQRLPAIPRCGDEHLHLFLYRRLAAVLR